VLRVECVWCVCGVVWFFVCVLGLWCVCVCMWFFLNIHLFTLRAPLPWNNTTCIV